MQSTNVRGNISLTTYLLLTFGSAWLIWSPLLVAEYMRLTLSVLSIVPATLGTLPFTLVVALIWVVTILVIAFKMLRIQKGLREQMIEIGESSI